jgi:putative endonuclease
MEWLSQMWIAGQERGLAALSWMARRRGRTSTLPAHLVTGIAGEEAAYFYLRRKGYIVVARRWSPGHQPGDIDLIAWQGQLLCIVEVKTRTARDFAPAEIAVDDHKRTMLRRLARHSAGASDVITTRTCLESHIQPEAAVANAIQVSASAFLKTTTA